jgi:hypothetical protein
MLELFVVLLSMPVKPDKIDLLLDIWLQSAEWNSLAKSFIVDKPKNKKKEAVDSNPPGGVMLGL